MSNKKVPGKPFEPGKSGNPKGRTPVPPELKAIKKLNAERFEKAVNKLTSMTLKELSAYIGNPSKGQMGNPECDMLERMIAGQINSGMKGKTQPVAFLCDRTMGPVKQHMQLDVGLADEISNMDDAKKKELRERIRKRREGS